ncbi:MAG: DUF1501 domain-containing protein [Gemmataceae bacterium]
MFDPASRRTFLRQTSLGLGAIALQSLLAHGAAPPRPLGLPALEGLPHYPPRIKRVIFLYMSGGPSHLETFDPKPKLAAMDGQPMPTSFTKGQPIAQLQGQELRCLGPRFKFARHGQSAQEISEMLPWTSKLADDICILRSMHTDQINHDPAHTLMNTGTPVPGRPSLGSWVTYGLGAETDRLPAFCVLTSFAGRSPQPISRRMWSAGFLPGRYQGVALESRGNPVHYVTNPPGVTPGRQRDVLDAVQALNTQHQRLTDDPEIATRIAQYELAFRMQASVPDLMDISAEPARVLEMYGAKPGDGSFASNCLLARRLAERGVRFIQLYHRDWDHHGDLVRYMNICCKATDRPTWALLTDLKQRGLLDDTLIIWGGEFGRTPMYQGKGKTPGRDHHMKGFSMWLAGGGIRGGLTYGATDDLGYNAVVDPVHVRDLHATILHLLGIDHKRLAVRHQGLEMRLTGVEPAQVLTRILT